MWLESEDGKSEPADFVNNLSLPFWERSFVGSGEEAGHRGTYMPSKSENDSLGRANLGVRLRRGERKTACLHIRPDVMV